MRTSLRLRRRVSLLVSAAVVAWAVLSHGSVVFAEDVQSEIAQPGYSQPDVRLDASVTAQSVDAPNAQPSVAGASPQHMVEEPPPQGLVETVPKQPAPAESMVAAEVTPPDVLPPDLPAVVVQIEARPAPVLAERGLPDLPPDLTATVADALQPPPVDPLPRIAAALKERLQQARPGGPALAELPRRDRELIETYYAARDFKPVFVDAVGLNATGRQVAQQIGNAGQDGLDPSAYQLPSMSATDPASLALAEASLAHAVVAYARDARGARLDPTRLSALITPELTLPTPGEVLFTVATASDAASALAAYQPQHAGYRALKDKLAELRESTGALQPRIVIGDGPPLRKGMSDPRVPALRARLDLAPANDEIFDAALESALAAWQRQQGLRPTGRLERGMAALLDGRPASGIGAADIVANMERWRWLPADLGARHIEVNLPEFMLRVVDNGAVVHQTRVVVGKPQTPTPIFSNAMQYVIVNPYWNIPPSILKKEILPKLAENPNYAAEHGYEVVQRGNSISVRQPPGERNALGFIKFIFPNQHSVYLHDTPSRSLFARDQRAFSHGCVRVDQPFRLGEVVLGRDGYSEERLRKLVGSGERTIRLKEPLPIHLTYFTLFVDESGRLQRREDLYGYDGRVKTALGINANGLHYANLK